MKLLNKNLLIIFICLIVVTSISVYGVIAYDAKDIIYSSDKTNVTNVQDALDELNDELQNRTNNPASTFYGVSIGVDDTGNKYFYFDGSSDYITIDNFTSSINISDGYSIEFKGSWDALNLWSRIIDCGNGASSDNILIANSSTSTSVSFQNFNGSASATYFAHLNENFIDVGVVHTYKFSYLKQSDGTYISSVYVDGVLKDSVSSNVKINNIARTSCYIGKSNWEADKYLNGKIYYMKFDLADGTNYFYLAP